MAEDAEQIARIRSKLYDFVANNPEHPDAEQARRILGKLPKAEATHHEHVPTDEEAGVPSAPTTDESLTLSGPANRLRPGTAEPGHAAPPSAFSAHHMDPTAQALTGAAMGEAALGAALFPLRALGPIGRGIMRASGKGGEMVAEGAEPAEAALRFKPPHIGEGGAAVAAAQLAHMSHFGPWSYLLPPALWLARNTVPLGAAAYRLGRGAEAAGAAAEPAAAAAEHYLTLPAVAAGGTR